MLLCWLGLATAQAQALLIFDVRIHYSRPERCEIHLPCAHVAYKTTHDADGVLTNMCEVS
jgi:hypothetical protein